MAPFRHLYLAGASLLLLCETQRAHSKTDEPKVERVSCLDAANPVRGQVGFTAFTEPPNKRLKLLPGSSSTFWKNVCGGMLKTSTGPQDQINPEGTIAYAPQTAKPDCAGAVESWKSAFTNFDGRPGEYKKGEKPYDNPQNVSFIALLNPKYNNPTMECAFVTCTPTSGSSPPKPDSGSPGDSRSGNGGSGDGEPSGTPGAGTGHPDTEVTPPSDDTVANPEGPPKPEDSSEDSQDPEDTQEDEDGEADIDGASANALQREDAIEPAKYGLVCLTNPNALEDKKAPFTEEEWQKITSALTNSAMWTTPAILTFAAAALAIALF